MTVRDELEELLKQGSNIPSGASYAFLRDHGPALLEALKDAYRWRKVRNAHLGVDSTPCLAMPRGGRSGVYINGEDADAAVDGMPYPEPSTMTFASIGELLVPFEIAYNICWPDTEYAKGYGDACGDIVRSVRDAIDRAREGV